MRISWRWATIGQRSLPANPHEASCAAHVRERPEVKVAPGAPRAVSLYMRSSTGIFLISVAACSASNGVGPGTTIRRPAAIAFTGDSSSLLVPTTARENEPFTVTFKTYYGGCESAAQTDVTTSPMTVEIRPFENEDQRPNVSCPSILIVESHSVEVTFLSVGTGHVILRGQKDAAGTQVAIDRPVIVVP